MGRAGAGGNRCCHPGCMALADHEIQVVKRRFDYSTCVRHVKVIKRLFVCEEHAGDMADFLALYEVGDDA